MEDQETLETRALISQLADSVKYQVNDFLANSVVTFCIVVGSIFIASDKLFKVEKLVVCTNSNCISLKLKSTVCKSNNFSAFEIRHFSS